MKQIEKKGGRRRIRYPKRLIFYILMLIFPLTQFAVFYVGVNLKSFCMAFQNYDAFTSSFQWVGLQNFKRLWVELTEYNTLRTVIANSLLVWFVTALVGTFLAVFFSYYVYKRFWGHGFFKIVLFLPSILPAIIQTMIFKVFVNDALPEYMAKLGIEMGPLMTFDASTLFPMSVFFTVWFGFGTSVLLYTGTMSQIDPSVIEAGMIDGTTPMKELRYIVIPEIIPTINTFLIMGIAGIFTNQANLMSFYGFDVTGTSQTLGYHLFRLVNYVPYGKSEYGYASALGLCCSAIAIPLTLIVRHFLTKLEDT